MSTSTTRTTISAVAEAGKSLESICTAGAGVLGEDMRSAARAKEEKARVVVALQNPHRRAKEEKEEAVRNPQATTVVKGREVPNRQRTILLVKEQERV